MMTPKEALIKDGTITVSLGRGRLSREATDRCMALAGQGWNIKGYEVSNSPATLSAPVVKKVAVTNEKIISDIHYTYPEESFEAKDAKGNHVGMREVCNTCRVSLVGHMCERPTVLGNIAVTIRPKKNTA